MKTQSFDTQLKMEEYQITLIRRASVAQRVSRIRSLSASTAQLAWRAIKKKHPAWTDREVDLSFVSHHYGKELADRLRDFMESKCL